MRSTGDESDWLEQANHYAAQAPIGNRNADCRGFIAGAGLIPKPATGPAAQGTLAEKRIVAAIAHRIEELWPLGREVGWLRELSRDTADE